MDTKPIEVHELDVKRFKALASGSGSPALEFYSKEIAWYANEDDTILGILLFDIADEDYVAVLLARDEARCYRYFDGKSSMPSIEDARAWLIRAMKWHTGQGLKMYPQGDRQKPIDLFTPMVPDEKQHPLFIDLMTNEMYTPAKAIIGNLMPYFIDVDGTFVREFQAKGLDARLWELYLNTYFIEEKLFIEREHVSPDFMVRKYGRAVAVEAVTVGRKTEHRSKLSEQGPNLPTPEEMKSRLRNEIPIKFGSPLYSKLQEKYWELPHVQGLPLVFAIADFHDDQSMMWTSTGLMHYLYGFRHDFHYDDQGRLVITPQAIGTHQVGDKSIPSGYFFQPDVENVSAVMFSATGTISKFNRIGIQAGFSHPEITTIRTGAWHNHDPNSAVPVPFRYEVNEKCKETWAEGLSMFHNPNARFPVPRELFPSVSHHQFVNGQISSELPEFCPLSSYTLHIRKPGKG